jgi:hypothetical protein
VRVAETLSTLLSAYGAACGLKMGVRDDVAWPALVAALAENAAMREEARGIIDGCTDAIVQRDWISAWKRATLEGALPEGIK